MVVEGEGCALTVIFRYLKGLLKKQNSLFSMPVEDEMRSSGLQNQQKKIYRGLDENLSNDN